MKTNKTKTNYDIWGGREIHAHADGGHVACDCFCLGVDDGQGTRT